MSDELPSNEQKLPVHGFVLAGGKSSRMGRDKALLPFRGRPMVQIAVEKLRGFCSAVSISGNREDLSGFAPVVRETRRDCGPVAGIEAGLRVCTQPWAMFVPVDVPMVPGDLLRRWTKAVVKQDAIGCGVSFLFADGREQPSFCVMRAEHLAHVGQAVEDGERRLRNLLWILEAADPARWLWVCEVETIAVSMLHAEYPSLQVHNWFTNINTEQELLDAETALGPR